MIGADALLKSLENHGVTEMFSYPGGAVLPIFNSMPKSKIRRILVRHEQGAGFAAAGFSRATKRVGVCLATSGPGATNLVTAIADAKMDSIPLVVVTGNVFKRLIGSDAFQEVDIVGICDPIVKHSYFVHQADDIPRIISEAFHLATTGRPGPVLIDIPKCVQIEEIDKKIAEKISNNQPFALELPGYKSVSESGQKASTTKPVEIIRNAKRPVVIYGHGVVLGNAEAELKKFLSITKIPSVWTLHGIGAGNATEKLSLGMLGMHGTATANFAVHNADVIIGIGIRFDDRITGVLDIFQRGKKIIHFDIDHSEFNKNVAIDFAVYGDVKETLPPITEALNTEKLDFSAWHSTLLERKERWPLDMETTEKFTEISVFNTLYKTLGKDDVVVVDVGQHQMWGAQRFFPKKCRKFLTSGGLGSMGFSLPTAMGAAFSGFPVWSISGDGGFQMNSQELMTIVQDQIPVKIIILNNGFLGMVRQWQDLFYNKNYVDTPLKNPDFVKLGEAYGIPSFRAKNQAEATELAQRMKNHKGPILAEFVVEKEESVFPMVPQGKSLGDTMLNKTEQIDNPIFE